MVVRLSARLLFLAAPRGTCSCGTAEPIPAGKDAPTPDVWLKQLIERRRGTAIPTGSVPARSREGSRPGVALLDGECRLAGRFWPDRGVLRQGQRSWPPARKTRWFSAWAAWFATTPRRRRGDVALRPGPSRRRLHLSRGTQAGDHEAERAYLYRHREFALPPLSQGVSRPRRAV